PDGGPARSRARATLLPNSVAGDSATTVPTALPAATVVPSYSMELRSATGTSQTGVGDFGTGRDSPVREDSSTSRAVASIRRRSAGTTAPFSSSMTSPTTSSLTGTLHA